MFFSLAAKRALAPSVVVFTRGFFVLCLSLLMSCGGGGGGGDDGGSQAFRVTLDRNSVSWTLLEGSSPGGVTITGTANREPDGALFVAAIVENTGGVNAIDPNIQVIINGLQARAHVFAAAGLAAGTYTGRILFLACSDPACNNRIGGTPLPVNFTVTVQPGVRATPGSITRTIESGNAVVEDVAITLGAGETSFTVDENASFVEISNQTTAGFRVSMPSLPAGTYTTNLSLHGSGGSRSTVPLTYTVTAPPGGQQPLQVNPSNVTLTTTEGVSSAPQVVEVTEATWRPGLLPPVIHYQQGLAQDWLEITPVAGGYRLVASAANLTKGAYSAIVTFLSNPLPQGIQEPLASSEQVPVTMTVGNGLITPPDVLHGVDSETTTSALSGTVDIDLVAGAPVNWVANSDVTWLTVTPGGVTGSTLTYSIDPVWLGTAANFADNVALVFITAPGTVVTPISFPVRVQRRLAEVSAVGARIQPAGAKTTLVVKGRGFAAITNPAARFAATGATPTSVQRVGDTKLVVSFDSLSVGSHVVSVGNALGTATSTASVIAVAPTPYAYDTVATGGSILHLAIDHETGTLYGVRGGATPEQGTLVIFRSGGGGWTAEAPPIPIAGVDNVGVMLDGDVIVTTLPGSVRLFDRNTFSARHVLDLGCTGSHFRSQNLPVTLDGRAWLSQARINPGCAGSPLWGEFGWYDKSLGTFELFDPTVSSPGRFANGPSFIMSRNGERLIMHLESNQTSPPMVYLDTTERVLHTTPQDQGAWFQFASTSDDASRVLFDHDRLLNHQFETVGRVSIPPYSLPFTDQALPAASVLSPDGSRAYVLTFPSSFLGQPTTPASPLPRVWVLDTSEDVGDSPLPVLGYFELADYPSCLQGVPCDFRSRAEITLDAGTLFFAGDERLVVAPIPPEGTLNDPLFGPDSRQQMKPVPWRLPKR
jgi:hypothetical protein